MIRPYTFYLLLAIQPFFEIIAISKIPFVEILKIIDFLEDILNAELEEKNKETLNKVNQCLNQD